MKKIASILVALALLIGLVGALPVSAAGSVNVWVGSTTVIIGDTLTVTLSYNGGGAGIGSLDARFTYNAEVFEYLSCTGATANGGSGVVTISYYSLDLVPADTLSITLNFRALTPGDGNFVLTTEGMYSDDGPLMENVVKAVEVAASNPTLSGNANLQSLKPSKGTLTPKFDPNKTEYTIAVAYSVDSVSFDYPTEHKDAKTAISGKNALQVGKNTRVITVTAPNGTTKKYTIVITRAAAPSTTSGTNPTTGTTLPQPAEDALDVVVDGKEMTILDTQASVDLPDGFRWSNLTVNRVEVPAAVNAETGMTLLYLTAEDKEDDGFYIYDADTDSFTRFRSLSVAGGTYLLYDLPVGNAPAGTVADLLAYEGGSVQAYLYQDVALSDFVLVWAAPVGGEAGWYTYDKKEGTLQRCPITESDDSVTTPSTTPSLDTITDPAHDKTPERMNLLDWIGSNATILLIGGIAIAALVVIILLIVMISSMGGRKKGKH